MKKTEFMVGIGKEGYYQKAFGTDVEYPLVIFDNHESHSLILLPGNHHEGWDINSASASEIALVKRHPLYNPTVHTKLYWVNPHSFSLRSLDAISNIYD